LGAFFRAQSNGVGASAKKKKKLEVERKKAEELDFTIKIIPKEPVNTWNNTKTQNVKDILEKRLKVLSSSLDAPSSGWIASLENASSKMKEKKCSEATLNYNTETLLQDGRAMLAEVSGELSRLEDMTRDDLPGSDTRIEAMHVKLAAFVVCGDDQIEGIKAMLAKVGKLGRKIWMKDYQLDAARCKLLQAGHHGVEYSKVIVGSMNDILKEDLELVREGRVDWMYNPEGGDINLDEVMLWDSTSAAGVFPNFSRF
jgi:hypothetical protein